jgi:hypothetical protein
MLCSWCPKNIQYLLNECPTSSPLYYNTASTFTVNSTSTAECQYHSWLSPLAFSPCTLKPYNAKNLIPTCLVGCHSDRNWLVRARVILGNSIHGPDLKRVIGMRQEVGDRNSGGFETILPWCIVDPTSTGPALAGVTSSTFLADHIVRNVLTTTCVLRTAPFQVHWCLIDIWNQVEGSRWWAWRKKNTITPRNEVPC